MKEERIDIRNAEKYHDPAPFHAIKNIERSERLSRVTPGGVYRIRKNVGSASFLGLVIARNEQVATVLNLYKDHQSPTDTVFDGYSTNLYMMGYAFMIDPGLSRWVFKSERPSIRYAKTQSASWSVYALRLREDLPLQ